jgi:hypothetical protein
MREAVHVMTNSVRLRPCSHNEYIARALSAIDSIARYNMRRRLSDITTRPRVRNTRLLETSEAVIK